MSDNKLKNIIYIKEPNIVRKKQKNEELEEKDGNLAYKSKSIIDKKNKKLISQQGKKTLKATNIDVACERRIKISDINDAMNYDITHEEIKQFINNILNYDTDKCNEDITDKSKGKKETILFIDDSKNGIINENTRNFILKHEELNKRIKFIKEEDFNKFFEKLMPIKKHKGKKIRIKATDQEQNQEQNQEEEHELTRVKGKKEYDENDENDENDIVIDDPKSDNFLYPELDDKDFNKELLKHKEFNSLKKNNEKKEPRNTLKELQDEMCQSDFELSPHQIFVKNFLSYHTPYNGLLLYHGLGTGKTCSAIGIAEEMRNYIKQIGFGSNNVKKIIIIASPNVQENFKLQLFDESKLKQVDGIWRIDGCLGNALLNEINPSERNDMSRINIIENIKRVINKYYVFYGYTKFGNIVKDEIEYKRIHVTDEIIKKQYKINKIKQIFDDRLIIIDEAHNIRDSDDNGNREVHNQLKDIAKYTKNLKLLLLTGTPMYNSHEEIVWIANLLNINDKRNRTLKVNDVFDTNGTFKSGGKDKLVEHLRGYISYVKGENPYTFPLRLSCSNEIQLDKPSIQMNGIEIPENEYDLVEKMPIYYSKMNNDGVQEKTYNLLINEALKDDLSNTKAFGYSLLQLPIESLNIVFGKKERLNEIENDIQKARSEQKVILQSMLGEKGMTNTMSYEEKVVDGEKTKSNFRYIDPNYKLFDEGNLENHSIKISNICKQIRVSKGIIMIYSQYIDGGVIPVALALEAMGFKRRVGNKIKNLFHKDINPSKDTDYKVIVGNNNDDDENKKEYTPHYIMLTGDERYSPDNVMDLKNLNNENNKNGENIKVVIISRAAGEGVDFRNLRQVHILEPWYNLSRIEQITGRSIRNKSHCSLRFEDRNVEIFLHATLSDKQECADLYLYRYASNKAKQIGNVTKVIKENAIDCLLKFGQYDDLNARLKIDQSEEINIMRSSGKEEKIQTRDIKNNVYNNFTSICDYTDNCDLKCAAELPDDSEVHMGTYNIDFAKNNMEGIMKRIRAEFKNAPKGLFYFHHDDLYNIINVKGNYTEEQFDMATTIMIEDGNELIIDNYGRKGKLINKDKWYYFQPLEITDINTSIFERSVPVEDMKRSFSASRIKTELKTGVTSNNDKSNIIDKQEKPNKTSKYNDLINDVNYVFDTTFDDIEKYNKFNWKHCFILFKPYLETIIKDTNVLKQIIIDHFIDFMPFIDTKDLLEEFLNNNTQTIDINDEDNKKIYDYFKKRKINDHYHIMRIKEKSKQPAFFKWNEETEELIEEQDITEIKELMRNFKDKWVDPDNFFGFIDSEIKFNKEEKLFKIREKNVAKNKKGSIIRGTYDKNKDIINIINSDVNKKLGEYIQKIKSEKDVEKYIINETIDKHMIKIKEPYITAALPTLIEILLRYKSEPGSFLSIDEFYLFSKSEK